MPGRRGAAARAARRRREQVGRERKERLVELERQKPPRATGEKPAAAKDSPGDRRQEKGGEEDLPLSPLPPPPAVGPGLPPLRAVKVKGMGVPSVWTPPVARVRVTMPERCRGQRNRACCSNRRGGRACREGFPRMLMTLVLVLMPMLVLALLRSRRGGRPRRIGMIQSSRAPMPRGSFERGERMKMLKCLVVLPCLPFTMQSYRSVGRRHLGGESLTTQAGRRRKFRIVWGSVRIPGRGGERAVPELLRSQTRVRHGRTHLCEGLAFHGRFVGYGRPKRAVEYLLQQVVYMFSRKRTIGVHANHGAG